MSMEGFNFNKVPKTKVEAKNVEGMVDPQAQTIAEMLNKVVAGDARARLESALSVAGVAALGRDGFPEAVATASPQERVVLMRSARKLQMMPEENTQTRPLIAQEVENIIAIVRKFHQEDMREAA